MTGFACCAACSGFVADLTIACVHCGAPPPRRRGLARFLLVRLLGVASAVTLMACYGDTSDYDCYGADCACYADSDCMQGEYCDDASDQCEWGGYCTSDESCPTGFECDLDRATCVPETPQWCDSHGDCALPEEQCDFASGECVPAVACGFDGATCDEGMRCDPQYLICVPCDVAAGTCGACDGDVTCAATPPDCPAGTRPGIEYGCYTASCIADLTCTELACAAHDEAACLDDPACAAVYQGLNCTNPEGEPCTTDPVCTCESYEYDSCEPAGPSTP